MVQQQIEKQPGLVVGEPILDETSPEQVAIEEKMLAGETITASGEVPATDETAPATDEKVPATGTPAVEKTVE